MKRNAELFLQVGTRPPNPAAEGKTTSGSKGKEGKGMEKGGFTKSSRAQKSV